VEAPERNNTPKQQNGKQLNKAVRTLLLLLFSDCTTLVCKTYETHHRNASRRANAHPLAILLPQHAHRRRRRTGKGLAIFNRLFAAQTPARWHKRHMKTNGGSGLLRPRTVTRHAAVIRFMFTRPVFVLPIAYARIDHACSRRPCPRVYYISNVAHLPCRNASTRDHRWTSPAGRREEDFHVCGRHRPNGHKQ